MTNKLTREQNILWAKRNLVDMIWKSAQIEGLNVTFPQTQAILEMASAKDVPLHDINVILNLKSAWKMVFDSLDQPVTVEYLCKLHDNVARNQALEWGILRSGYVGIGGTDYIPPVPNIDDVEKQLEHIKEIDNPIIRATETMMYLMKSQLFWDGNKRLAFIVANKILIENGMGTLELKQDNLLEFNTLLHNYYQYDQKEQLKEFLIDSVSRPQLDRNKQIDQSHEIEFE